MALLASPLLVRCCIESRVRPRTAVWAWFAAIVTAALATTLALALVFLHFFAASLLAAMGDSCGGIFASGHSFLAASRLNYLLAAALLTALFAQAAFLAGGGIRLLTASRLAGRTWGADARSCPALERISGQPWAGRVLMVPGPAAAGALTVGLLCPRILMPAGLVASLDGNGLRAIAAHEEAHRAARDNLLVAVSRTLTLTFFYLPGFRLAYTRMRSAMEQAADSRAAEAAGGPLAVADTLMVVASLIRQEEKLRYATGVAGGEISDRIETLLKDAAPRSCWRRLALFTAMTTASVALFTASSLAVASDGHNEAVVCFARHHLPENGVCDL